MVFQARFSTLFLFSNFFQRCVIILHLICLPDTLQALERLGSFALLAWVCKGTVVLLSPFSIPQCAIEADGHGHQTVNRI